MENSLWVKSSLLTKAPSSVFWKALTNPDITKQYMFGCEVFCEWKIEDPIIWKGAADGVV